MVFDFVVSRKVDPEHQEFPQVPLGGRVPNHVSGWQIAPCQWAVIPSAQHHV